MARKKRKHRGPKRNPRTGRFMKKAHAAKKTRKRAKRRSHKGRRR